MFNRKIKRNRYIVDAVDSIEEALEVICSDSEELDTLKYQKLLEIYDFEFPKEMIKYINKINGSIFNEVYVKINKKKSKYYTDELSVMNFLLFEYSDKLYSISSYIDDLHKEYPEMIPIAKDAADNLFCISKVNNAIYFLDREEFFEEEVHFIADSFEEFIKLFIYIN